MKRSPSENVLTVIFYAIAIGFSLACLYPFLLVLISSVTDEITLQTNGYSIFPDKLSTDAYVAIFRTKTIPTAYLVTTFVTVVGTLLSLIVTSAAAYALAGRRLYYGTQLAFLFYFTMLFSGGIVSQYILITKYLHLQNTVWVYILPALFGPWNMFLMRNFFNEIPEELFESAKLEGAGEMKLLTRIALPLSLPAMATIGLFYALGYWSVWQPGLLYVDNPDLFTLQYIVMQIIRNVDIAQNIAVHGSTAAAQAAPSYTVRLATAVVTIGPIVLLYPFLQRYFVGGLKVGAIKG